MYQGPGAITISRPSRGLDDTDFIEIEVEDARSGRRFARIRVPAREFAMALTGMAVQPCTFELDAAMVGKKREVKTEIVPIGRGALSREDRIARAKAACAPFEVDGWKARYEDACNHHLLVMSDNDADHYRIGFTRFTD